jgi:hypothetical protein
LLCVSFAIIFWIWRDYYMGFYLHLYACRVLRCSIVVTLAECTLPCLRKTLVSWPGGGIEKSTSNFLHWSAHNCAHQVLCQLSEPVFSRISSFFFFEIYQLGL